MSNVTVRVRIIASFAVIVAILLLANVIVYLGLSAIERDANRIENVSLPGLLQAATIRSAWVDHMLETQSLMVDLADREERMRSGSDQEIFLNLAQQLDAATSAYEATVLSAEDRRLLEGFKGARDRYLALHDEWLALMRANQVAAAERFITERLRPSWATGRTTLNELLRLNEAVGDAATHDINRSITNTEGALLVSAVLALLAAIASGLLLLRAMTRPIGAIVRSLKQLGGGDLSVRLDLQRRDEFGAIEQGFNQMAEELNVLVAQAQRSAVQMTTSVTEIAASAKQQQSTASETAATAKEIGATSREIAATSRELVQTMGEVSGTAEQTSVLAGSGQHGLARMEEVMRQVTTAAETVNGKLAVLNEKAGNITQMVTTIVKVSDQTNLLSLNAAIEAEKAGEYGRGFAVVASEVRRLADQTAVASYDIEQMVREIQSAVSAGVMGMDRFSEEVRRGLSEMAQVGGQLSEIIQQVQALAPRIQTVNEGMQAQASGAEQINEALTQLGEASGQTAEAIRQAGRAMEELNQVATDLRAGVTRFKV
ncbi:methyl-accepting chemotaxis protein [Marinibaculum pumilum]|uniref:Methyl-accepting chemotaxis protein n=1 Tax=Marinibaculum pumilum TaxID=1766165 RepID=A0ABV7LA62_9PROT